MKKCGRETLLKNQMMLDSGDTEYVRKQSLSYTFGIT